MFNILKNPAIRAGLLSVLCLFPLSAAYAESPSPQFQTDQQAQRHCPKDTVVWVNLNTGVYHYRGQRWYGNTNHGAYECMKEANKEGDRPTRNGQ